MFGQIKDHTKTKYVLVTPARNEGNHIEKTIQAVVSQTIRPVKWIIVSDGSTDNTEGIVRSYVKQYSFIDLIRLPPKKQFDFASKVYAIRLGYQALTSSVYDFVGNLDADISFDASYYETLLVRFQENSRLGIIGGFVFEERNGEYELRRFNSINSVAGAIQLFRRRCYESVGGYLPLRFGGEDWAAETMARMKGWEVRAFPELRVLHDRITGTSQGNILKVRFEEGIRAFTLGSDPLFEVIKDVSRVSEREL